MKWWDQMPWWILNFKPSFSLSSFTLIESLFSSSLLSAIWVVSSAYLRWLMFLQEILIPICASTSLTFCIMYSAYKSLSAYRVIISNLVLYAYTLVMKFWVLASQFCMSILSSIHTQHVQVLSLAFKHFFHITFMLCDICDYVIGFITQHQYSFIHQNLITWLYLWFIIFPHFSVCVL